MQIIKSIKELRSVIRELKVNKKQVGFVPTMGALHPGHLALIKASKEECDCTVLSIYVNPIQFNDEKDFSVYPRDVKKDAQIAKDAGVDILFTPDDSEMYSKESFTFVDVGGDLTNSLCGMSRPGHFRGVVTVVSKLFNIVQPDKSYFGLKDAQQAIVVSRMASDLNFPVVVRLVPTEREKDGIAYSSRNENLSASERKNASVLYQALCHAKKRIMEDEEYDAMKITGEMYKMIGEVTGTEIDYISIVSLPALKEVKEIKGETLIAMAVIIGKTRLIDNIILIADRK